MLVRNNCLYQAQRMRLVYHVTEAPTIVMIFLPLKNKPFLKIVSFKIFTTKKVSFDFSMTKAELV